MLVLIIKSSIKFFSLLMILGEKAGCVCWCAELSYRGLLLKGRQRSRLKPVGRVFEEEANYASLCGIIQL